MVYRIDMQNFLIHAIDHFSLKDLTTMQYVIISGKITNGSKENNVVKLNELYPSPDITMAYAETGNKDILEKMYLDMLKSDYGSIEYNGKRYSHYDICIYRSFINPLLEHYNITIICDRAENEYIDPLCKYLKDRFDIEVIDLNELFTKGRVGEIYIDIDDIRDRAVDIRRASSNEQFKNLASTRDGKSHLISRMKKKEKLRYLERFGVPISHIDTNKDLDAMLLDAWCDNDENE